MPERKPQSKNIIFEALSTLKTKEEVKEFVLSSDVDLQTVRYIAGYFPKRTESMWRSVLKRKEDKNGKV